MSNRKPSFSKPSFSASQCLALAIAAFGLIACGSSEKGKISGGSGGNDTGVTVATAGGGTGGASTGTGVATSGGTVSTSNGGTTAATAGIGGTAGSTKGAAAGGISTATGGSDRDNAGKGGGGGGEAAAGSGGAWECPATATTTPGDKTVSITVGDLTRTFIQHLPSGYNGKTPMPVVIDFHGRGGSASTQKSATDWGSVADQKGFIMVWPDGVGNTWNAGRCCGSTADDIGFVRAMIETLKKDVCIDPKRVYATGCSAGGGMTYKVACDAADLVAAVAPVDFDCAYSSDNTGQTPSCGGCTPKRPISEIQFRGTNDQMALYDGGIRSGGTNYHAGALKNFAEWGEINQCTGTPEAMSDHPACQVYPTCSGDVLTALCTVQNGTHCGSYQSFGIVNIAWETFQKYTLP